MKKIVSGLIVSSLMVTNALSAWIPGDVEEITQNTTGIYVKVGTAGKYIDPHLTSDEQKSFLAMALSAQMAGKAVEVNNVGCVGTNNWCKIRLKK